MSQHRNLEPGTPAPQTGLYACGYCAPGGLLETLTGGVTGLRGSDAVFASSGEVSARFEAGAALPECQRCGPATGWDLVEGSIEDYRRGNAESQRAVYGTLGIGAARGPKPARHRSMAIGVLVVVGVLIQVVLFLLLR